MFPNQPQFNIDVLDVNPLSYADRVTAATLQGLVNRRGPRLFLDYGIYDDPLARRTNEVFMADEIWYGKYRRLLGAQDQHNLEYYRREHNAAAAPLTGLDAAVKKYRDTLKGCVLWEASLPDTVNVALMLAAQEDLLPLEAASVAQAEAWKLPVVHDLRGRWTDRVELYTWAFENLFAKCERGRVACIEPDWQRPEFLDYLVQHKIFIYNLSSQQKGLGGTLLLLLAFGPATLREFLFALHLDVPLRRWALSWLGRHSAEIKLNNRIQRSVAADPVPTIFGWHTHRDDEMTFMLLLSANGLRLVPTHLAANFSFHSQVTPLDPTPVAPPPPAVPELDPQGVYLTFTLSDGDQLMMMSTAELGSWYCPKRGSMAFNWECQPLLTEIAPALLERFQRGATPNDCLIAGPSGAGYTVPPLTPDFPAYMRETVRICRQAGITVATTYVADPPRRVLRQLDAAAHGEMNFLAGYAILSRAPQQLIGQTVVIANQVPTLEQIWANADDLLAAVKKLANGAAQKPAFIGVHLFAYRTAYEDVAAFAEQITDPHIHIVRADTFLALARRSFSSFHK
jgi:hypothetical protein